MSFLSMAKTLTRNLFQGPATVLYPIQKKETYSNTRGRVEITIEDCISCGMCQRSCPTGAIEVQKADVSWSIDRFKCVQCGYCVEVCPKKCLHMNNQYSAPAVKKSREKYARISGNTENH